MIPGSFRATATACTCFSLLAAALHGWRLDYGFQGRRKTLSLGTYPDTGLSLVRQKADEARCLFAQGVDPSEARIEAKVEASRRREAELRGEAGFGGDDSDDNFRRLIALVRSTSRRWTAGSSAGFSVGRCYRLCDRSGAARSSRCWSAQAPTDWSDGWGGRSMLPPALRSPELPPRGPVTVSD